MHACVRVCLRVHRGAPQARQHAGTHVCAQDQRVRAGRHEAARAVRQAALPGGQLHAQHLCHACRGRLPRGGRRKPHEHAVSCMHVRVCTCVCVMRVLDVCA